MHEHTCTYTQMPEKTKQANRRKEIKVISCFNHPCKSLTRPYSTKDKDKANIDTAKESFLAILEDKII